MQLELQKQGLDTLTGFYLLGGGGGGEDSPPNTSASPKKILPIKFN